MAAGRTEEARGCVEEAMLLMEEMEVPAASVRGACLLALLPGGDAGAAVEAWERYAPGLGKSDAMEFRFLLWRVTKERAHLEAAHGLLEEFREQAPEEYRDTMVENVPLHRDVVKAWAEES